MAWLKLFRIAALPSALSNILVGYLLANGSWQAISTLGWLLLSSACLYCAGMVLNDVFDADADAKERPNRPIPSGAISLNQARFAGFALLGLGVLFAAMASSMSLFVAVALAVSIYLYDGPLKRTVAAPFVMGLCRSLNILLGASAAWQHSSLVIGYAAAIGVFIAGVTWLAKEEAAEKQSLNTLLPGGGLMVAGLGLACFVVAGGFGLPTQLATQSKAMPGLIVAIVFAFLSLPILMRLLTAIASASSQVVQGTVITSLRSLIAFDACAAMLIESGRPFYSLAILSLLAASVLLRKASKLT